MKILYFSPHPNLNMASPSGYGTHMREMATAFKNLGHQVETLIIGGETLIENTSKESIFKKLIRFVTPKLIWESIKDYQFRKLDKRNASQLIQLIKKIRPDIVYERCAYYLPCGAIICKQLGIKHILECNAPIIDERIEFQGKSIFIGQAKKLERIQMRASSLVLFVSSALKDHYQAEYDLDAKKILVTPNAINPTKFQISTSIVEELRAKHSLKGQITIGFLGSILPYHGIEELLNAFKQLNNTHPQKLKLLIVGGGETLEKLKVKSQKLGVERSVIFTGNIPHNEVLNYVTLFDIAVLPKTNWYCSPIKIFEYALANKPVVSINASGVSDVMKNNSDGLLFNSPEEMLNQIEELINDENKRVTLAANFHKKVLERYTWAITAKNILKAIK